MQNIRPIDAFKKYFLDVKPYHTKILETVERYAFEEDLPLIISESIMFHIAYKNDPLCRVVGYGYIWDGECGFDAVDCCDLFDCLGGFGIVFDNSALVNQLNINSVESATDVIRVGGNHVYDVRGQVDSIPTHNTIQIFGDYTPYFAYQKIFLIVPVKTMEVIANTETQIFVSGNHVNILNNEKKFKLYNTGKDDGLYNVITAEYDTPTNRTIITISENQAIVPDLTNAFIEFKIGSRNNGAYRAKSVTYDGSVTTIVLSEDTPLAFTNTTEGDNHGSIQLRTGMRPGREIEVEETETSVDGVYTIIRSDFEPNSNETVIYLNRDIDEDAVQGVIKMYGYVHGAGFDGPADCSTPKHMHIKVGIAEKLIIEVSAPEPSVTPTFTPTITPTPSVSIIPPAFSIVLWFEMDEDSSQSSLHSTNKHIVGDAQSAYASPAFWSETSGDVSEDTRSSDYTPLNMLEVKERTRILDNYYTWPTSIRFKPDGSSLFIMSYWWSTAQELQIDKPWSIGGAKLNGMTAFKHRDFAIFSITFSRDGTKFYYTGNDNRRIYQHECLTPWDVSTATSKEVSLAFNTSGRRHAAGVDFSADGTKFFIAGNSDMYSYTMSTPWDVSTATFDALDSLDLGAPYYSSDYGGCWSYDGMKYFFVGDSPNYPTSYLSIYQFSTPTPWDITSLTDDGKLYDIPATQHTGSRALHISDDGTKLYLLGEEGNYLRQYTMSTALDLDTAAEDGTIEINNFDSVPQDLFITPDGNTMYVVSEFGGAIGAFTLGTSWDALTATFTGNMRCLYHPDADSLNDEYPIGMFFKPDGTKLYITGYSGIYELTCSPAWDLNTSTVTSLMDADFWWGLSFSDDGSKLFGCYDDTIVEFSVPTPWDVSSVVDGYTPDDTMLVTYYACDMFFKPDGTAFYVVGSDTASVYKYTCGTPWTLSTASLSETLDASFIPGDPTSSTGGGGGLRGICFSPDGKKIFLTNMYDALYEFDLDVPWVISSGIDQADLSGRQVRVLSANSVSGWDSGTTRAESFNFDHDWFHWVWCIPEDRVTDKCLVNVGEGGSTNNNGWYLMLRGYGLAGYYILSGDPADYSDAPYVPYDKIATAYSPTYRNEIAFVTRNAVEDEMLTFSEEYIPGQPYLIATQWDSTLGRMGISVNGSPFEWHTPTTPPVNPTTLATDDQWIYTNMVYDGTVDYKFRGKLGQIVHGHELLSDSIIADVYNSQAGIAYWNGYAFPSWWPSTADVVAWWDGNVPQWMSTGAPSDYITANPVDGESLGAWVAKGGAAPPMVGNVNVVYRENVSNGKSAVEVTDDVTVPVGTNTVTDYTNVTIFWTISSNNEATTGTFFSSAAASDDRIRLYGSTEDDGALATFYPNGGTPLTLTQGSGNDPASGEMVVRCMRKEGTNVRGYYNGTLVDSGVLDADSFVNDSGWVFANDSGTASSDPLDSHFGEIIVVEGVLDDAEVNTINNYLMNKWIP